MQRDIRARAVTKRVRLEHEINPLCRVHEIERAGISEPARADRSRASLQLTPTGHVEFINDHAFIDIGHADVQSQMRSTESEMPEQRAACCAPSVDEREFAF